MPDPPRSQGRVIAAQMPLPLSATLYRLDKLPEITALNPGAPRLPQADISKQISAGWKNEREEVRGHYSYRFQPMTRANKMRIREQLREEKKHIHQQVSSDKDRVREQVRARYESPTFPLVTRFEPDTVCDVCAEEFGAHNPPKSIPCGHILCGSCITKVCEKTPPRLQPSCPFCRDTFTSDVVRCVPADYYESAEVRETRTHGRITLRAHQDAAFRKIYVQFKAKEASRIRADVQRLEDKAAEAATQSSSAEELTSVSNELQDWLSREYNKLPGEEHISLLMSAALLRSMLNDRAAHTKGAGSINETYFDDRVITKDKLWENGVLPYARLP